MGVWAYTGQLRRIIGRFKYEGRTCYAADLAEAMLTRVRNDEEDLVSLRQYLTSRGELWIVPVPLDKKKAKRRGYNQAELLARELAERLAGKLVIDLVAKKKTTTDQVKLGKKERIKNLRGVFKLRRRYKGKVGAEVKILLVDDVATTGTTMLMIGRLIKRNFKVPVWGLAVAR